MHEVCKLKKNVQVIGYEVAGMCIIRLKTYLQANVSSKHNSTFLADIWITIQMYEYPYQCVFTLGVVSFSV